MNLETQLKLAANMKRLRLSHGYSQTELARRLHVNRSVLAQCESGQRCPNLATVYQLAQLYGISVENLLETDPVNIIHAAVDSKVCEDGEQELVVLFRKLSPFSKGRLLEKAEDLAMWDATFLQSRNSLKHQVR